MWRGLLVLALASCDKLLSLGPIAPLPDAPPDASMFTCTEHASAFWCADFDEAGPITYGDGMPVMIPAATANITAMARAPASSDPNALWVDATATTTGRYDVRYSNAKTVTRVHVELDVDIAQFNTTSSTEIAEIGIDGANGALCHLQLQIDASKVMNVRYFKCNGATQQPATMFLGAIPVGFAHYALDLDIAAGLGSVTFDDATTTVKLATSSATGGTPYADVGVFFIGNPGGPQLAFDNVIATAI